MRYWIIALIITLSAAVYQRMTGPSYPFNGKANIGYSDYSYKLKRSYTSDKDCPVKLNITDSNVTGTIYYKRFKTNDPWTQIPLQRDGDVLTGYLPRQPAAGKLEYYIELQLENQKIVLPENQRVIVRFKDSVPAIIIIPHVFLMFLGMLFSNRAALECLRKNKNPIKFAWWTFGLLFAGGMILGPFVQKYAFGDYWTGVPFGIDLTDNKMLIAIIFWIPALIFSRSERKAKTWVLIAAIVTLVIFSIPHSLLGSELDYKTNQVIQAHLSNTPGDSIIMV